MRRKTLYILFFISFLASDISYAAGLIYRVQEIKAMRQKQQQPSQDQYDQYAQGQQQNATLTYQQTVDQRNQAIAQAILNSNNPSVSNIALQNGNGTMITGPQPVAVQSNSTEVKDVVDLSDVWKKLDTKSTVWTLLIDDQAKLMTVSEYIDRFQKEGVKINESPAHYVAMIDQITQANPDMLNRPFGELLQIVAIVDYDFDNGMDKDLLAKKVLGEAGYEANKQRFTQQGAGA